ncbi:MAG: type II secretion system F family protein [Acidobacteriia bacterium]|nr:type II secretion system F family protein [Terriglobia bacterium]
MSPLLLFGLLLLLTFVVLVWVLKPTKTEADVERHLSSIGRTYGLDIDEATILKQEALSSIPFLDKLMRQIPGIMNLRLLITQAGMNWSVSAVLLGSFVVIAVGAWVASLFIPALALALLVGIAAGAAPYAFLFWKRAARFQRFEEVLPEAIDLMSRALKAGHSVTSMIEMVAQEVAEPVASEFRTVFEQQNLGLPLRESILNLASRVPLEDVHFLATAILVQKETGGNLAEILDKAAFIMRERARLKGQLRIYTAQGRLSAWILCLLPFAMFFIMSLLNPEYERKLYTDPLGIHAIYLGVIMMALGIYVIRKIVDIKV